MISEACKNTMKSVLNILSQSFVPRDILVCVDLDLHDDCLER